jgi:hypothetical protein
MTAEPQHTGIEFNVSALLMNWWQTVTSFFAAPAALIGGDFQALPIVATLGLACLLAGIALAVAWRVTQTWCSSPPSLHR